MGKKEKERRAKVAKRNRKIAQEKYATQKAIEKMMERMKQQSEMDVKIGDESVPFEVLGEADSLLMQQTLDNVEPEFDSAGFTVEDREENVDTILNNLEFNDSYYTDMINKAKKNKMFIYNILYQK